MPDFPGPAFREFLFHHDPEIIGSAAWCPVSIQPEPFFHYPFDVIPLNSAADFLVYRYGKSMIRVFILQKGEKKKGRGFFSPF
jgi:hypothetical protein